LGNGLFGEESLTNYSNQFFGFKISGVSGNRLAYGELHSTCAKQQEGTRRFLPYQPNTGCILTSNLSIHEDHCLPCEQRFFLTLRGADVRRENDSQPNGGSEKPSARRVIIVRFIEAVDGDF